VSYDVDMKSTISSLFFWGSVELDINHFGKSELEKISSLLKNEHVKMLKHDLKLAPASN
jgi:hypothetical protein